jgi:uncharacterized protein YlxW (UPF0749 family)
VREEGKLVRNWQVSIALVCILLGIFLVAQLRTQQAKGPASMGRSEALAELYKQSEEQRQLLEREIDKLREQLAKANERDSKGLVEELRKLRTLGGLTSLTGPGIILTLDDSKLKGKDDSDTDMYLIHYEDLLLVVNELYAAGAEAVSINGQRLISTSEIRCAGPTILVNSTRVTPPFEVLAIGDPDVLKTSLEMRGGVLEPMRPWGIQITIAQKDNIIMPPYKGTIRFRYAQEKQH